MVLDADADLARVNVLWHVESHGNMFAAIATIDDLWEEITDLQLLGLFEWNLDDQVAIVSHEADQLLWDRVLWQLVGLLELLDGEVIGSLDLVLLMSRNGEDLILELGLDRIGLEASAVDGDAILLWNAWEQWQLVKEVWLVEPMEVLGNSAVQLIEWIVQVQ